MRTQKSRSVSLAVLTLVLAGCAVSIETQPARESNECNMARVSGILAVDSQVGVGLADGNGVVRRVIWPFGYSARREQAGVVLIDDTGRIVAREGQRIETAGGFGGADDVAYPCGGPVRIVE